MEKSVGWCVVGDPVLLGLRMVVGKCLDMAFSKSFTDAVSAMASSVGAGAICGLTVSGGCGELDVLHGFCSASSEDCSSSGCWALRFLALRVGGAGGGGCVVGAGGADCDGAGGGARSDAGWALGEEGRGPPALSAPASGDPSPGSPVTVSSRFTPWTPSSIWQQSIIKLAYSRPLQREKVQN